MTGVVTSVPEWALGDPPPRHVLRADEAAAFPLELPDLDEPRPDAEPHPLPRSPVWSGAYRDGHAEGLATGRSEGLARGEEEGARRATLAATSAIESLRTQVATAVRAQQDEVARLEQHALELALDLAEMVLGHHVAACDDPGTEALTRALAAVRTSGPLVARLHPEDLALMGPRAEEADPDLELVADPEVGRGGCILDAATCRVDATLGSALERVREVLDAHHGEVPS